MLSTILKDNGFDLALNMLDVGAVPIEGEKPEPYYRLLEAFPSSRLSGFELDGAVCKRLNENAARGARFYPCALGRADETRPLYNTRAPMCTSLYEPDERYAQLFGRLDAMRLANVGEIRTTSLDSFAREQSLGGLDFVKIDVQGAELDVFKGGVQALREALFIVCEVEFVPMYKQQPLFADVDAWLRGQGMMFHKFLGMAGRVAKPLAVNGRADYPSQFLWSDAVFVRDLFNYPELPAEQQLKLAVLFDLYESKDLALHLLRCYDAKNDDDIADLYLAHLLGGGTWSIDKAGLGK
jgi:FkbM family methyltransferase